MSTYAAFMAKDVSIAGNVDDTENNLPTYAQRVLVVVVAKCPASYTSRSNLCVSSIAEAKDDNLGFTSHVSLQAEYILRPGKCQMFFGCDLYGSDLIIFDS